MGKYFLCLFSHPIHSSPQLHPLGTAALYPGSRQGFGGLVQGPSVMVIDKGGDKQWPLCPPKSPIGLGIQTSSRSQPRSSTLSSAAAQYLPLQSLPVTFGRLAEAVVKLGSIHVQASLWTIPLIAGSQCNTTDTNRQPTRFNSESNCCSTLVGVTD